MLEQGVGSLVVTHEPTAIDIAVAGAVLEWDSPLPSGRAGRRQGIGSELARALAGNCNGAVARQPLRPVLVTRLQRLLDQQTAKTRSVDKEIRLDALAALERQRLDKAVLAPKLNIHHFAFCPTGSTSFGVGTQVARVEASIKMICVLIRSGCGTRIAWGRRKPPQLAR